MCDVDRLKNQGRPDTATLCNELASVSDWHKLGLYLGVQDYELDQIERSRSAEGCDGWKRETFSLWLKHTPNASWRDVVGALRRMGENSEAERIELKFIIGGPAHASPLTPPSSAEEFAYNGTSSTRRKSSSIKSPLISSTEAVEECNTQMMKGKFSKLVTKSRKSLQNREIDVEEVQTFLIIMYSSPNSRDGSDMVITVVESAESLNAIFRALTKYGLWDYINYYLLQSIIKEFASDDNELNGMMKQYQQDLTGYTLTLRIKAYLDVTHCLHPTFTTGDSETSADMTIPPQQKHELFKELSVKIDANVTDHTFNYVIDLWQSLAVQFALPQPAMILHKVAEGCIGITWLIPANLVEYVTRMAQKTSSVFAEKHILRVMLKEQCIYPMETNPPLLETEPPLLETEPPLLETNPPLLETEPPLLETEPPLTEPEKVALKKALGTVPEVQGKMDTVATTSDIIDNKSVPMETEPSLPESEALSMVSQAHRKRKLEEDLETEQPAPKRHTMSGFSDSEGEDEADHSSGTNPHGTHQSENILPAYKHGHVCEIISPPAWAEALPTTCPICLQVLRNPRQTDCGHIFCDVCIGQFQASHKQTCPECKQTNISIFPHESLRRLLNDLQVQCTSQNEEGVCDWTGKLRELDDHLNLNPTEPDQLLTGCKFVSLQCEFRYVGCEAEMPRKHMAIHMKEDQYHHIKFLAAKINKQSRQIQKQRKQIQKLTMKLQSKDEEMARLKQQKQELRRSTPRLYPVNFCFTMVKFKQHKENDKEWYSEPFYTHPRGYKMRVRIDANGFRDSTFVALYTCIMRGEYDDELSWPFRGKVSIELQNQKTDDHHLYIISYDESAGPKYLKNADRVLIGKQHYGLGSSQFMHYDKISQNSPTVQYLKDDCLKFQVREVLLYS